jgi:ABC-type uncharacterized transport system involved in gliding motility auxiliary subunit
VNASTSPPVARPAPRRANLVGLATLASLLLLVALVLANAALARASVRLDLTEEGLYTLDSATERVVRSLGDPAEIRVYWSEEIPASANAVKRRVEGLLDEYAARSDGRLTVTWVDLAPGGPGVAEAEKTKDRRGAPLPEYEFRTLEGNTFELSKGYMGLTIRYLDQVEFVGPLVDPASERFTLRPSLEYEITTQLWRMARGKPPGVAVVKDSPGFSFATPHGGDRFTVLAQLLEETYGDAAKTWLSLDDPVPPEVETLLVAGPKEWPEKRVFHLEQFVLRGGKAIVLLDPVHLQSAMQGGPSTKSGLEAWLSAQGVEVAEGVVADFGSPGFTGVRRSSGRHTFAEYPFHLLLLSANLDPTHPLTAPPDAPRLDRIPMYFPVEVRLDEAKHREAGRKATVLATTTEEGYLKPDTFGLDTLPESPPNPSSKGRHPVVVAVEGRFVSYWKGKPSPADPPPAEPAAAQEEPTAGEKKEPGPTPPADPLPDPGRPDGGAAIEEPPPDRAAPEEKKEGDAAAGSTPPPAPPGPGPEQPKTPPEGSRGPEGPSGEDAEPPAPAGMDAPAAMADEPPPSAPAEPVPAEPKTDGPPVPAEPEKDEPPAAAPSGPPKAPRLDEGSGTLLVAGDAEWVSDHFSGVPGRDMTGNVTMFVTRATGFPFVLNAIDWSLGSAELMSLRGRGASPRRLEEIEPDKARSVKVLNYVAVPVLVLILGILVWVVRRFRA